jgi:signal peptidase I
MTENEIPAPPESESAQSNEAAEGSRKPAKVSRGRWLFENIASLALALLIVFMIRSSVVEAFKIPSGSMIPTLMIGDHIFVDKFAYGLKIPFSDVFTDHPIYVVKRDGPQRGDIIVFIYPKDESYYYIKRVIGTPGDTVELRNKVLYINNQMVTREQLTGPEPEKLLKSLDDPKYSPKSIDVYREHLGNVDHLIMNDRNNFMSENFPPTVVPPDSLFVMGDNRDFSNDSRFWGFVPMKNVKGKAMVIWFSFWVNIQDGVQYGFRPDRIGTLLH